MAAIGTLTIEMAANVARLQKDMDQARRSVDSTMKSIQRSVDMAKKAMVGLGATLSAGAFVAWINNAIKAADEMKKLSQKTGVAVKDLAGLQLAYKQSGLGADALQTSMARLSKGMAEGNKGFTAMGLSVKNADGSLKSTRVMLGEVADKFASYRDGAEKTALAMQLFGKSGAEMIPLLNAGAKSLEEYDKIAKQLGLTLDDKTTESAEKFNDTLELVLEGSKGLATQVAAKLLPTLENLAGAFLTSMTEGDRLAKSAEFIAAGLKIVYSAAVIVAEVFNMLGTRIGATFAAIAQATEGDFKGAWQTWKQAGKDIDQNWTYTIAELGEVWNGTGDKAVSAMVDMTAAGKKAAPIVDDLTKEQLAFAKAVEAAARALVALEDAQTKALAASNKQRTDQEVAQLQWSLDQKLITERQFIEKKNALEMDSEQATLAALEKAWQDSRARMADKEKAAMAKGDADPVAMKAYYEAARDEVERLAAVQAARSESAVRGVQAEIEANRALQKEIDQRIAQENAIIALLNENVMLEASMVGGNSEMIGDQYAREMAMMDARYKAEFDLIDQLIADKKKLAAEEKADAAKRARFEQEARLLVEKRGKIEKKQTLDQEALDRAAFRSRLGMASNFAGSVASVLESLASTQDLTSREGFETAKDMQLAAAYVNTAGAIMNALATVQPYPLAIAAAAAAAAAGAAQISAIQSTEFGETGGGFTVPSGGFSSGGGGGGGGGATGSAIGPAYKSVQELQTAESLQRLAAAADNASLAVGKMSDVLTSIGDIFEGANGGISKWGLMNTPNFGTKTDAVRSDISAYTAFFMSELKMTLNTFNPLTWFNGDFIKSVSDTFKAAKTAIFGGGWQTTGAGIALGLSGGDLLAQEYIRKKKSGGLIGSTKRRTRFYDMDPEFEAMLVAQVDRIKSAINLAATITGTTANFAMAELERIQIQTSGQKPEDVQKALEDFFQSAANALAATTEGLQEFAFSGENAFDALIRLATVLQSVNESFRLVGVNLMDATLEGANAAFKLQELMGGADAFGEKMHGYFEAMFTEEEQNAKTFENNLGKFTAAFDLMNSAFEDDATITLPKTREQFRAIVESLDVTTERGAALFAALMDIAPTFGALIEYMEQLDITAAQAADIVGELVKSFEQIQGATDAAFAALQRSIAAEKKALDGQKQAIQEQKRAFELQQKGMLDQINELTKSRGPLDSLFKFLGQQIEDLYRTAKSTVPAMVAKSKAVIASAIISGVLPDQETLSTAVGTVRDSFQSSNYRTSFEMQRDQLVFAGRLSKLQGIAGSQLSGIDRQIAELEKQTSGIDQQIAQLDEQTAQIDKQLADLDAILSTAQAQLDALRGIDTSVYSIKEAMAAFLVAVKAELTASGNVTAAENAALPAGILSSLRAGDITAAQAAGQLAAAGVTLATNASTQVGDASVYKSGAGALGVTDQDGLRIYFAGGGSGSATALRDWVAYQLAVDNDAEVHSAMKTYGVNSQLLDMLMGWQPGAAMAWARQSGLPEFAAGTNYVPQDMLAMIHKGEAVVPAAYNPSANGEIVGELRALREETRAQARSMVQLQNRMTRVLEKWDGDGIPEERAVA